jgi:GH18 family chitinase
MCSHIIYAYATVDAHKPEIIPVQKDDLGLKKKKPNPNEKLDFVLEHYRELALLKKSNPNLKISIRLGGKISQYTRYLKHSNMAAQLVRSLIW